MTDDRAYRVHLRFDPEAQKFHARAPELDLHGSGPTRADALAALEGEIESRFQAVADGESLPRPIDVVTHPEALTVALSQSLRRELAFIAREDGLSVEALAAELIARGLGERAPRRQPRGQQGPNTPADQAPQDGQPSQRPGPREDGRARNDRAPDRGNERAPGNAPDRGNDRGPPRGRGGQRREGYRPELDDKANFLEYLRGLDKPGGGRSRGR